MDLKVGGNPRRVMIPGHQQVDESLGNENSHMLSLSIFLHAVFDLLRFLVGSVKERRIEMIFIKG